ncbi:hypothetical protein KQX54_005259 [Cotesia glomerata]|uniref:Uncharacterized protein n=1 Tax=Cotesia glomerata TaxID=32391 RepID=A0AAV7I2U2_COTGL|nr:hypothetical protein KQX54_005259 [Cotesia glomerata]
MGTYVWMLSIRSEIPGAGSHERTACALYMDVPYPIASPPLCCPMLWHCQLNSPCAFDCVPISVLMPIPIPGSNPGSALQTDMRSRNKKIL